MASGAFGRWVASVSGYTPLFLRRAGGKLHIISLRKANPREVKRYDKTPKSRIDR